MTKYLKARIQKKTEAADEHPILFAGEMSRAIREGRKTQTRRVIKPQPVWDHGAWTVPGFFCNTAQGFSEGILQSAFKCPYGVTGDRLWGRETHYRCEVEGQGVGVPFLVYPEEFDESGPCPTVLRPWQFSPGKVLKWGCRPSIFMFRWASRLLLEVKDVRVERVQDITEEDAEAEGIFDASGLHWWDCLGPYEEYCGHESPEEHFARLWDSINAKPKPAYTRDDDGKKVIDHYVSYPWENVQEARKHRGKPWLVIGNPWVFVIVFLEIKT